MNKFAILALAACLAASAQEKKEIRHFEIKVDGPTGAGSGDHVFVGSAIGPKMHIAQFQAKAVKGAPYAAEATSESVQTLADGNRIVNKNTSKMYRDAEGRTRMENTISPTGMWVPQGREFSITMITDPVAGVHYTLNSNEKTATKVSIPTPPALPVAGQPMKEEMKIERKIVMSHATSAGPMPPAGAGPAVMVFERREGFPINLNTADLKHESLGKQTIEGVQCDGTRETFVIPAGKMGNEREIKTVTERWYSPDLGFDMLRKTSDPRTGETTYRVTSLVRSEQPKSLFEVPSDYKLEESNSHNINEDVVIKRRGVKQ